MNKHFAREKTGEKKNKKSRKLLSNPLNLMMQQNDLNERCKWALFYCSVFTFVNKPFDLYAVCEEKTTKSLTLKFKDILEKMNQEKRTQHNKKKLLKNIYLHKTCRTTWVDAGWPTPLLAVQMYVPPLWRSILSMSKTGEDNFSSPTYVENDWKKNQHVISIFVGVAIID